MVKTSSKINSTTTTNNTHKKTTQGRKKIEIKKINEKSNLQVTFSKRRNGLFKKANELCLLCGAEVAVITFSPGRKAYTFGHPGVEELVDRYLGRRDDGVEKGGERHAEHVVYVNEANKEYEDLLKQLEEERKRGEELEESNKKKRNLIEGGSGGFWWEETNVDELGLEELEVYVKSMQELQENVVKRISELNMMESLLLISNNNANNNSNLYDINCNNNMGGGELMLVNSNVNQNTAGGSGSGSSFIGGNYGGGCENGGCNCEGGGGVVNEFGFRGMGF